MNCEIDRLVQNSDAQMKKISELERQLPRAQSKLTRPQSSPPTHQVRKVKKGKSPTKSQKGKRSSSPRPSSEQRATSGKSVAYRIRQDHPRHLVSPDYDMAPVTSPNRHAGKEPYDYYNEMVKRRKDGSCGDQAGCLEDLKRFIEEKCEENQVGFRWYFHKFLKSYHLVIY